MTTGRVTLEVGIFYKLSFLKFIIFLGKAHAQCNLNYNNDKKVPVFIHNGKSDFLMVDTFNDNLF